MKRFAVLLIALCLAAGGAFTQSVSSVRLTDTIDKGVGGVNLLKNVSAAALEGFRAAHGGRLVFGVDVNEAANGTEKAASQGVTVDDAWLELRMADGSTRIYGRAGAFWTETQALLAPAGQTVRAPYYTLLGESGSSRITANGRIQSIFDSTLKIAVSDDISGVVAATLRIRLLDPNVKLGDPEAFYDFSAGFEDLALLSPQDALYIDTVVPTETVFRTEAPAMELSPQGEQTQAELQQPPPVPALTWVQQPAAGSYEIAAYEDLFPGRGDFDFNDLVVAYRYQLGLNADGLVERIEGVAYLIARGSTYRHDWTLDLPLPAGAQGAANCSSVDAAGAPLACNIGAADGRLRWAAFIDTVAAFPAPGGAAASPVNTIAGSGFMRGPKASFSVTLATPIAAPAPGAADPWLFVRTTGQTVRVSDRSAAGYPFALKLPSDWKFPVERQDIGLAYPGLATFVSSSGSQSADWMLQPVGALVRSWSVADWAW
jgi:hypothetical protein